jgi:TRAP-type C4-dicarboxylate transport system permease small subunit
MTTTRRFQTARALLAAIDRASYALIVFAMGTMAVIVALQVFLRYALSASMDSAEELSRLAFVWAMFLAIPHGIRYGVHVGIDVLVILFPEDLRRALFRVTSGLGALLMVLVLYAAIFVTADKWQDLMPTIEFTAAVFYIAVLISAAHSLLHLLLLAWGGEDAWKGAET